MSYHVNNTYAKLAPYSIQNKKKTKEIMRYTGGTPDIPFAVTLNTAMIIPPPTPSEVKHYSVGKPTIVKHPT